MESNLIVLEIIKNPFNPNAYKKLANYYEQTNKPTEALALFNLAKLYHEKTDNSNTNEK